MTIKSLYYEKFSVKLKIFEINMKLTPRELKKLIKEEVKKVLEEGTWSSPKSEEKARELFNLFQEPIPLGGKSEDEMERRVPKETAEDRLYNLIGNDDLFDRFIRLRDNNYPADFDVRPLIADFIEKRWYPIEEERWSDPWSEAGKKVIEYIVKNFSTDQDFDRSGIAKGTSSRFGSIYKN